MSDTITRLGVEIDPTQAQAGLKTIADESAKTGAALSSLLGAASGAASALGNAANAGAAQQSAASSQIVESVSRVSVALGQASGAATTSAEAMGGAQFTAAALIGSANAQIIDSMASVSAASKISAEEFAAGQARWAEATGTTSRMTAESWAQLRAQQEEATAFMNQATEEEIAAEQKKAEAVAQAEAAATAARQKAAEAAAQAATQEAEAQEAATNKMLHSLSSFGIGLGMVNPAIGQTAFAIKGVTMAAEALGIAIAPMLALLAPLIALGLAIKEASSGIAAASGIEDMTVRMGGLLGSVEAVKDRFDEIRSMNMPFKFDDIEKGDEALQRFTDGALAGRDGLKLIGDAAAATGNDFSKVAEQVARLNGAIMSGSQNAGRYAQALVKDKVLTPADAASVTNGKKEGEDPSATWDRVQAKLAVFNGAMVNNANTWTGLMTIFGNKVEEVFDAFGKPIMDSLKPYIAEATSALQAMIPIAGQVGAALAQMMGNGQGASNIGHGLLIAGEQFINFLVKGMADVVAQTAIGLAGAMSAAVSAIKVLCTPDFWSGLLVTLLGIASKFGTALLDAFAKPIASLETGIGMAIDTAMRKLPNMITGDYSKNTPALDQGAMYNDNLARIHSMVGVGNTMGDGALTDGTALLNSALMPLVADMQATFSVMQQANQYSFTKIGNVFKEAGQTSTSSAFGMHYPEGGYPKSNTDDPAAPTKAEKDPKDPNASLLKMNTDAELLDAYWRDFAKMEESGMGDVEKAFRESQLKSKLGNSMGDANNAAGVMSPNQIARLNEAKQAAEMDEKIKNGDADMFSAFNRGVQSEVQAWGNAQQQMASLGKSATVAVTTDITTALQNMASGTVTAAQAFRQMAQSIMKDIADMIIKMEVQEAVAMALKSLDYGGGGLVGGSGGTTPTSNVTDTVSNEAENAASGLASGGYTGDGGRLQPAGIVHKGEYVFSQAAVQRMGVGNLESMHQAALGYADGGLVTSTGPAAPMTAFGGARGGDIINVQVNVDNSTTGGTGGVAAQGAQSNADQQAKASAYAAATRAAILQVIQQEQRQGGLLAQKSR